MFAINLIAAKAMQRIGTYWHVLPTYRQGRMVVWNGMTRDGRRFLDAFPPEIVESVHNNEMRVRLKNGSVYQVMGSDEPDSLVGGNPIGVVMSEYSIQDPRAYDRIRPMLTENGGWAMFIFTPRSRNWGWKLFTKAQRKNSGWFHDIRKAGSGDDCTKRDSTVWKKTFNGEFVPEKENGGPVVSDEQIDQDRSDGMSEEMIDQDYKVSFESSNEGTYYGKQMAKLAKENRLTNVPYDPKLPVNTYWDIGVGDSTAIVFAQLYGLEIRIIDYYENSGEGLAHYIRVMKEKDYLYGSHFAPWDIEVTEFSSGKTRLESARKLGVKFKVTQKHEIEDGIEQVRSILPRCWIDVEKCDRLINALMAYAKEPLALKFQQNADEDGGKKVFKDTPIHSWASHPADAIRYMAWNIKYKSPYEEKKQHRAEDASDLAMPTW